MKRKWVLLRQTVLLKPVAMPSLLEGEFKSSLVLESSGLGLWHFPKPVVIGYSRNSGFLSIFSGQWFQSIDKLQRNARPSTLSTVIVEPSHRTTWTICDTHLRTTLLARKLAVNL